MTSHDESLRHWLRLSMVSGIGPLTRTALLERFETPEGVFRAGPSQWREVPGVGPKTVTNLVRAEQDIDVDAELSLCAENGVTPITLDDERYPQLLKEIPDPPGILFVRGEILPIDGLAVGIVGTRHATDYGRRQSQRLAGELVRAGYTVVSGLARGIDAEAHKGAINAGGRTLAVLGGGVLSIYPPEHDGLAAEVAQNGAVISEMPPRARPMKGSFPQRNRIITGLSLGLLVIEASDRSGALISARHAMEQNRDVFAIPGRVDRSSSRGCHKLLRDGATLVESVDDIIEMFGPLTTATPATDGREVRHPAELQLNEIETSILDAISDEATSIDHIVTTTGLAVPRILSTISVLEMRRLVRRVSGTTFVRAF